MKRVIRAVSPRINIFSWQKKKKKKERITTGKTSSEEGILRKIEQSVPRTTLKTSLNSMKYAS